MRYFLFAGDTYYPRGGMKDFIRASDDLEKLKDIVQYYDKDKCDWFHIVEFCESGFKVILGGSDEIDDKFKIGDKVYPYDENIDGKRVNIVYEPDCYQDEPKMLESRKVEYYDPSFEY